MVHDHVAGDKESISIPVWLEYANAIATSAAALLAAGTVVQSSRSSNENQKALIRERRIDFELDVLADLAELNTGSSNMAMRDARMKARAAMLAPEVIPVTRGLPRRPQAALLASRPPTRRPARRTRGRRTARRGVRHAAALRRRGAPGRRGRLRGAALSPRRHRGATGQPGQGRSTSAHRVRLSGLMLGAGSHSGGRSGMGRSAPARGGHVLAGRHNREWLPVPPPREGPGRHTTVGRPGRQTRIRG